MKGRKEGRKRGKRKKVEREEEKRDSIYKTLLQNKTKIARMSQVALIYLGPFRAGNQQQYHMDNQASLN